MSKKIAFLGSGYVGLVASACIAELGYDVVTIDIDEDRIKKLQSGNIPIYEPGLQSILEQTRASGKLEFTSNWESPLKQADIVFIAVGTPKREDGSCDIQYVISAAEMIGQTIDDNVIITTKSTVPVGTGELILETVNENLSNRFNDGNTPRVEVVSNPEFLREGSAVSDFKHPDRVVVGSESETACRRVAEIYQDLNTNIVETGLRTAEMIKYASNAMLATKISFINEIANVCELVGADVEQVSKTVGLDHRIGKDFLQAGIGYGGSCFPKDTEALVQIAGQGGYRSQILSAVMAVNQQQRVRFARKIIRNLPNPSDSVVAVLGLSFKPNTDDMREAPSIDIIQELQTEGVDVRAYDPASMDNARQKLSGVEFGTSPEDILSGADAAVLLTEWSEFVELNPDRVQQQLNHSIIFDGRNALDMAQWIRAGFDYYGVGRGSDRLDGVIPSESLLAEDEPSTVA